MIFLISFASLFSISEYGAGMNFINNIFPEQSKDSINNSKDSIITTDTVKTFRHEKIGNDSAITNFYNKLENLKEKNISKLTIYHFGDSHIKGGFLTNAVKAKFYEDYEGIEYISFGINGASFRTFINKTDYLNTIQETKPDIVIISLGTNDASGDTVIEKDFLRTVDDVIISIREIDPFINILFTTPPDYVKKGKVNKNTAITRDLLIEYAIENNIAYWDLFDLMGGEGSCLKWFEDGLMAKDKIHFTKAGYEKQAYMFYDSLIGK
jgi:lysophospholipase L1-like esterase